jgi:hypothetical protein
LGGLFGRTQATEKGYEICNLDNIRTDLRAICLEGAGWIKLVHDRDQWQALVNKVMNFSFFIKGTEFSSVAK